MDSPFTKTASFLHDDGVEEGRFALDIASDTDGDEEEEHELLSPSSSTSQSAGTRKRFQLLQSMTVPQQEHLQRRKRGTCLSTAIQIAIYTVAAWGVLLSLVLLFLPQLLPFHNQSLRGKYDVYHPSTLPPSLTNLCDCGLSIATALARGCVYDTLAAAWLPPYCRDAELTSTFDVSGPGPNGEWSYYLDPTGAIPLSLAELAALGGTETKFWASRRWHVAHCLFYWQKLWRMRETGLVMEERFDGLDHIRHCSRLILKHIPEVEEGSGRVFLLDVPVMMNASSEAAKRAAARKGHDD